MCRWSALAILLLAGCASPVQSIQGARPSPPGDVFTCYMRELATMQYRVDDSDRDAGFIRALLEDGGLLGGEYGNEVTVTVIPAGETSEVNVTMRRVRITAGGGRSTASMMMTSEAVADLDRLAGACQ